MPHVSNIESENARRRNCATNQNKKKSLKLVSCEKLMKKHR